MFLNVLICIKDDVIWYVNIFISPVIFTGSRSLSQRTELFLVLCKKKTATKILTVQYSASFV